VQTSLIFDKIPLGIIVFDESNDIISINDWGEEFFAKTSDYLQQIIQEMVKNTLVNHKSVQKIIRFSDQTIYLSGILKLNLSKCPHLK
jgi:c-di-AMP phosphodiesterase-like protein